MSLYTVNWMIDYFKKFAEPQPNEDGVVHFGQIEIKDIIAEYNVDFFELYNEIDPIQERRYCHNYSSL